MATATVEASAGRIGIYGGAFDPVHRAHIALAKAALRQFELQKIIFVPTGKPPHRGLSGTSQADRLAMLDLATRDCEQFVVDTWEFRQSSTTYTYETLSHFCQSKTTEYFFLMGGDSLLEFTSWHRWEEILQLCHLAVAKRPGSDQQPLPTGLAECVVDSEVKPRNRTGNIYFIDTEALAVSATSIRDQFSSGVVEGGDQLHPGVAKYIQDNRLYQNA